MTKEDARNVINNDDEIQYVMEEIYVLRLHLAELVSNKIDQVPEVNAALSELEIMRNLTHGTGKAQNILQMIQSRQLGRVCKDNAGVEEARKHYNEIKERYKLSNKTGEELEW